jgi:hypothetical protein
MDTWQWPWCAHGNGHGHVRVYARLKHIKRAMHSYMDIWALNNPKPPKWPLIDRVATHKKDADSQRHLAQ